MIKKSPLDLILPAFGAGLITILAQFTIPLGPIPFSLQNFAVGLVVTLFKPRQAFFSVLLYLLLGAVGLPVFAGSGGLQVLLGPTSGYLWGYLLYAFVTGPLTNPKSGLVRLFLSNCLGDTLVLISGSLVLSLIAGHPLATGFGLGFIPFVLPDTLKILVISLFSQVLFKRLKELNYYKN